MAAWLRIALFAAAAGVGGVAYACTLAHESPCDVPPDSTLYISIRRPELFAGQVLTDGGCSAVRCTTPVNGGCSEWQGKITATDAADVCVVRVDADAGDESRTLTPTFVCGIPNSDRVEF